MSRAGRWTRKENQVRLIEIWNAIIKIQPRKSFATVTDIGNEIGMGRSTHLKNLIFKLVFSEKIDVKMYKLIDGRDSYRFYFSDERLNIIEAACDMPWICERSGEKLINGMCREETPNGLVICPVSMRHSANPDKRKTQAPGTPAIRIPADKLVQ